MAKKKNPNLKRYWQLSVTFSVEASTPEEAIEITDRICADVKQDYGHYVHLMRTFAPTQAKK